MKIIHVRLLSYSGTGTGGNNNSRVLNKDRKGRGIFVGVRLLGTSWYT